MICKDFKLAFQKEAMFMVRLKSKIILATLCLLLVLTHGCSLSNRLSSPQPPTPSTGNVPPIKEKEPVSSASKEDENMDNYTFLSNKERIVVEPEETIYPSKPSNPLPVFTKEAFTLIGLSIGEERENVIRWFGEPAYIYQPSADLVEQVHEYDGYLIGYSVDGKVKWIKVTGEYVNPLLPNIHVGSTKDEVLTTFGKPDFSNEYQVHYIHSGDSVLLKMDIDPATSIVQSISLFKVNDL